LGGVCHPKDQTSDVGLGGDGGGSVRDRRIQLYTAGAVENSERKLSRACRVCAGSLPSRSGDEVGEGDPDGPGDSDHSDSQLPERLQSRLKLNPRGQRCNAIGGGVEPRAGVEGWLAELAVETAGDARGWREIGATACGRSTVSGLQGAVSGMGGAALMMMWANCRRA
jgi:hypothetical protein